jgi:hypothetical protein
MALLSFRHPIRGVNLGSFLITLSFLILVLMTFKLAQAYFEKSKLETMISNLVMQNKGIDDDILASRITSEAASMLNLNVARERILVFRTGDRRRIRVDVSYEAPVRVFEAGWDMTLEASISELLETNH